MFLSPTNDIAFKKLFSNAQHTEVVINFLNSILCKKEGDKIVSVIINDPNNQPLIMNNKQSIVDVLCIDQQGSKYIIEMQVNDHKNFVQRAHFYNAFAISNQLSKGEDYKVLVPVIFVAVLDFTLFEKKQNYLSHHYVLDRETLENDFAYQEFHIVELKKFHKQLDDVHDDADKWIYFLKNAKTLDTIPEQLEQDSAIKEAFHILEKTSWTSDEFVQYLKSWDEEVMEKDALETAEERGIKKEKVKMALRLLALKTMDANTIAQLTELAVEEIEKLKNDNNI